MNTLLDVRGLSYSYAGVPALNGVSLSLPAGQIAGLLGPNGCGKTTFLKILAGLIRDHKGEVTIAGGPVDARSKSVVSFLPEKPCLPGWMRAGSALSAYADFYTDFDRRRAEEMMARFGVPAGKQLRQMSKGTQEKLQLILVMSRAAELYLLDEPLGGIDPAARAAMIDVIISNYAETSSVLLSTHLIHDVERIFDHVFFLKEGRLIIDKNVDQLRAETGKSLEEHFREVYAC